MEEYVCFKCGNQVGSLKGVEMFCTKCKRKMFKVNKMKKILERSLVDGILISLQEQVTLELN